MKGHISLIHLYFSDEHFISHGDTCACMLITVLAQYMLIRFHYMLIRVHYMLILVHYMLTLFHYILTLFHYMLIHVLVKCWYLFIIWCIWVYADTFSLYVDTCSLYIKYMVSRSTYLNICPEVTGKPWKVMSPDTEDRGRHSTSGLSSHLRANIQVLLSEKNIPIYVINITFLNKSKRLQTYLFH